MSSSPRRYRAAVLSSEYPPYVFGGLGVHVDRLTAAMAEKVSFAILVPAREGYPEDRRGIAIHPVPIGDASSNEEYWLGYCHAAVQQALTLDPGVDLIHCHDWMTVLAGLRLRVLLGRPLVFHVHLPQLGGPMLYAENLGLLGADLVLVNSRSAQRELEQRRLPIHRLAVVPNGVDLDRFQPSAEWPVEQGYLLFVGRLVAQKGIDNLLHAFGLVLQRFQQERLVIVGDGELELYLKSIARHLGFPDRVTFVGWKTGEELVGLFQHARAVIVPSYYEPFGIVALEAMACGRPVVASRLGGLEEIVDDGVQGYLVPAGDRFALAERLADLLLDADRRQAMGRAARLRAQAFGWPRVGEETFALYDDLIRRPLEEGNPRRNRGSRRQLLRAFELPLRPLVRDLLTNL